MGIVHNLKISKMYTKIIVLIVLLQSIHVQSLFSQSEYWKKVQQKNMEIRSDWTGSFVDGKAQFYTLDFLYIQALLENTPNEFEGKNVLRHISGKELQIPMPDGEIKTFSVFSTTNMEPELALKFPAIHSFKGFNINNPKEIIRFDTGPYGFHGLIGTDKGMVQIDPVNRSNKNYYVTYFTEDYISDTYLNTPLCGMDDNEEVSKQKYFGLQRFNHEPQELRQYRLAMACTPSWAASRGTVENCLADMNTMVNRANLIYEKELAIRMVLIAKNDQIVFLDAFTNPYTNTEQGRSLINQNTQVVNQRVGSNAYDIGHVLSRCFDVGGIASLGSICTGGKGAGVTCHNNNNIESIVTRVLSHEMGHQMSASHTFSSCGQTDQLSLGTAFEPGSGTTIMSYAGGCGSDNVTNNNDDYYHVGSLDQMLSYTNWTNQDAYLCATKIDISNTVPTAKFTRTGGFTIPASTPFELTGEAVDIEDDPMTYVIEQYDAGGPNPYGSPVGNVPVFRSLRPNTKSYRFFPNESRILSNRLYERDEIIPTYSRVLTFRYVVRDNNPSGTAANWDQIKFNVSDQAGPFRLTYPFTGEVLEVGQKITITWDVANTNVHPVSCKRVNIYLSVNDELVTGRPNLVPLALNVDNDGEEFVVIPNRVTNKARIVIKAADNIFLTTGAIPSTIKEASKPSFFMQILDNQREACLPASLQFEFETEALGGLTEPVQFEVVEGLPVNAVATFNQNSITAGEKALLDINLQQVRNTGIHEVVVRSFVPGVDTIERKLYLYLTGTDLDYVTPLSPENGKTGTAQVQNYQWARKIDAVGYEFELATNPSFSSESIVLNTSAQDTFLKSTFILDKSTIYYWRTRALNHCRKGEWSETFAFSTEASSCFTAESGPLSLNISPSGLPRVEGSLFITQDYTITDINVKKIRGDHERVGDLDVYLISPQNTELQLWSKRCGTSKGFNIGLDDQSIEFFKCPINTGKIYKPDMKLNVFHGQSSKGVWKVRVEDNVAGEGGRFHEFSLEVCTNVSLESPLLVKNSGISVPVLASKTILNDALLSEDANNTANQLTYTMVTKPVYGVIRRNNEVLDIGSSFTQDEINNGRIFYQHTWSNETKDGFLFTVIDGEGGWIPVTKFDITIEQSTSSNDISVGPNVILIPNPAEDKVQIISFDQFIGQKTLSVFDLQGKLVLQNLLNQKTEIDISSFPKGMYIVQVTSDGKSTNQKLIKK